jgi:hypothetical protein
MKLNSSPIVSPAQLEILGFDRIGFVEEVTRFSSDYGHIVSVYFEADGVRSQGFLKINLHHSDRLENLIKRLKAITGLVRVRRIEA